VLRHLLRIGCHARYGNGRQRPLLRGWLHALVLLAGGLWLRADTRLHPTARRFALGTSAGYLGSVFYHLVPWPGPLSYQAALCVDFVAIQLTFLLQTAALAGAATAAVRLSLLLVLATAALCVAGLAQLGRPAASPLWLFGRHTRRRLLQAQVLLSCAVELATLASTPTALGLMALKLAAMDFFVKHARFDAPKPTRLCWSGLWADHDTFHVICLATHALQLWACARNAF